MLYFTLLLYGCTRPRSGTKALRPVSRLSDTRALFNMGPKTYMNQRLTCKLLATYSPCLASHRKHSSRSFSSNRRAGSIFKYLL